MKNNLCALLTWILTAVVIAGCGSPDAQESLALVDAAPQAATASATKASDAPVRTVALVMKTLTNPFFVEMEKGARRAEQELGVNLIVKTGAQETSVEQQIAIVDTLIGAHVDAIVIAPADSTELIPALKAAQDAGIVVINIDNQLDPQVAAERGLIGVPFISVDNEQGAYNSAKVLSDRIDQPAEVVVLEGIRTAKNAADRTHGALRAFGENPNITVVAQETAHWKIDEAYDVIARVFAKHPNVKAIFAANDMMALGVVQFLAETGRTSVTVVAYDALDEAKKAIREGSLLATVDQQAAQQGYLGVDFAVRALNGEKLPPITLVETRLVTADSVDK